MLGFLIALTALILVTVVPVMIAARALNAGRTGFWICLVAVLLSSVAGLFISDIIVRPIIAVVVSFVVTAIIYTVILRAKFLQALVIAILSNIIQFGMVFFLAWVGISAGVVA